MDRGSWLFRCVGGIAVDGGVKGRQLGNVRRDPARLVLGAISSPICAPAHPRNKCKRAAARRDRGRHNRRLIPQPSKAAGIGGRIFDGDSR